jgi:transcriptional regulator GlxA family with amidase domain
MPRTRRDDSGERVATVLSAVRRELQRPWTVEQMAAVIGINGSQLRRLCLQVMGSTPRQVLTRLRLETAADLLKEPRLRVKEILGRIGVNDASHFCRDFRKHFGVSPLEFRSRARATLMQDLANRNAIPPIDPAVAQSDDRGSGQYPGAGRVRGVESASN